MLHQTCPNPECFQQALEGHLSRDELEAVAAHLEGCSACLAVVRALPNGLADLLRRMPEPGGSSQEMPTLVERILQLARPGEPPDSLPPEATTPTPITPERKADAPSPFLEPPQQPGEIGRLGRYRILSQIGRGGMGVVFQAEDPRLQRQMALKIMRPELAARPLARERFLREARAMAALEHESIVPVFEADEATVGSQTVPYLVMPLLKGETLAQRLHRPEAIPMPDIVRIGREIADGLATAHAAGLIHRDIKPGNVFLTGNGRVKILDFGLVRAVAEDSNLTVSGQVHGTPAYMAPEQAEGRPVDGRADLFSLGCVLYHLATGAAPFSGPSTLAILRQLAVHEPLPARTINPEVPSELSALIEELLRKDPTRRPLSAQEVAERLARVEAGFSIPLSPEPTTVTLPRPRSRFALWAGGVAGLVAALVVIVVVAHPRTPSGTGQPVADALAPLKGSIDVRVFGKDDPQRQNLFLDDPGAVPLRPGDEFCIEAKLNRPAYAYVLWIDTEGEVVPVYPWKPKHWEDRPADEHAVHQLRVPEALDRYYSIKAGTPGMDTLVLLARDEPLPPNVDLRGELGALPQPKAQGFRATAWFENGVPVKNERGRAGNFDERQRDDPVLQTQERIRERLVGKHFSYVLAVSFADRGK